MGTLTQDVDVKVGKFHLKGMLTIPENATGIVLFAHGSGSSRFSPRNQYVAGILNDANIATLLMDLLTPEEEQVDDSTREHRFNIPLLAERLAGAIRWLGQEKSTKGLNIGLFGSSTGAAAALVAAAQMPEHVAVVVSRGGRPDLAGLALEKVAAPTLLIVGGWDTEVIKLNNEALALLRCEKKLDIVPQATHLFEENGKLDHAARLACGWFKGHFRE